MSRVLKDTFGRLHNYLRVSLTERCNLRCVYCMPEHGVTLTPPASLLTSEELRRLIHLFASLGVNKVRLTGGEPTVRKDIVEVCRMISTTPGIKTVAMTTNGIVLHRYLPDLIGAGLTGINISLDTLQDDRFTLMTRRHGHQRVLDVIKMAEVSGAFPVVKINCVVMKGVNDDEICDFAEMTRGRNLEVRFIEFMPFDDNHWERKKVVPFMEMMDRIERRPATPAGALHPGRTLPAPVVPSPLLGPGDPRWKLTPVREMRPGDTARLFRLPDHRGTVGFITCMTSHFCGQCNRLRLTADGNLKVCLFGEAEVSLRDAMRRGCTDEELTTIISTAVLGKHEALGGRVDGEGIARGHNRPMITIGG